MMTETEIIKLIGDAAEEGNYEKGKLLTSLLPVDPNDLDGMRLINTEESFELLLEAVRAHREKDATEARIKLRAMGVEV